MSDPVSLYAVLELEPGATDDDIRRAYKRMLSLFEPGSPVPYGLYRVSEAQAEQARFKEAYETLMDPERKRRYDRQTFSKGQPSQKRAEPPLARTTAAYPRTVVPPVARPTAPRPSVQEPLMALGVGPEVPLTGAVLARVRRFFGYSLEEIAEKTKISVFALRSLELDQYEELPAPVYLRGFLKQFATFLRLPPERVLKDYLAAVDAWRASPDRKGGW